MIELTPEQKVAKDYSSSIDSVNLLLAGKPEYMAAEDWADVVARNKEHLRIQVAKGADYYGSNDLTPLIQAIE